MKIVMLRPSYCPEISGGNHLAADLVEDATRGGDEVLLVVPFPHRAPAEIRAACEDKLDEVQCDGRLRIHRIKSHFGEGNLALRALRMAELSARMIGRALREPEADAIVSHSMPVFLGPLAAVAGRLKGVPVVYWEQDLVSNSILSTGALGQGLKKKAAFALALGLERFTSRFSAHVITISERFRERQIQAFGKAPDAVDTLFNWIDPEQVRPIPREENFLFDKHGLDRRLFYVTYCGNLGLPQNVEILIDAAKALEHLPDLRVVIFGDGVRRKAVEAHLAASGASNVRLFPLEPLEHAACVYSLGDVGLVIGRKGTSGNGFPSKTWSILAAGQALIACFDEGSELGDLLARDDCGVALPPDSPEALARAIEGLYRDRRRVEALGQNARRCVSENYSRARATRRFLDIVHRVAGQARGGNRPDRGPMPIP